MLTVNPYQLAAVILMAIWVGSQIGHLLTLWQIEAKDRYDQSNKGDE